MNNAIQGPFIATAFISCSLRSEDKHFIDLVERILVVHRIKPIGTIGKYAAAPINPAEHMRENIPQADLVVIIATPRYLQKDLQTEHISYGLSEMVHVEAGMAYMAHKPVIVFVQEGTHVGSFLPNITQYITLNGKQSDLESKWTLIFNLVSHAYNVVKRVKELQSNKEVGELMKNGLALIGGIAIFKALFSIDDRPKRKKIVRVVQANKLKRTR